MIALQLIAFQSFSFVAMLSSFLYDGSNNLTVTGVSGLWVLSNISFAGMRAQNNSSIGWRPLAFIFGLPGTVVTFFTVKEGGERAYGIDIPKRRP